jgi:hypothetical protein
MNERKFPTVSDASEVLADLVAPGFGDLPIQRAACLFGLKAQGHIPTIERMLAAGASWEDIGREIGWCPETAERHYGWHQNPRTMPSLRTN